MRTVIESFNRVHLRALQEQRDTATTGLIPGQLDLLEKDPWTITLMAGDRVLMCGGVVQHWPGRGEAWAILAEQRHEHVIAIHRAALRMLEFAQNTMHRIEAAVRFGHSEGRRWVEHLGFQFEGVRRTYLPDKTDAALYVRFH